MMKSEGNVTMRRWAGQAVAAIGIWALCLTTGCGTFFIYPGNQSGSGGSSTGDYVYVANAIVGSLAGFSVGTGTLTAVTGSPISLGFSPSAVAVNPANTLVFVAGTNGTYGFVNVYSIGSTGALTLLMSNNVGAASEVAIDISPDGDWLVGLDANGPPAQQAIVDEYQINSSTGQLTQGNGAIYQYTGSVIPTINPLGIKFAPNENYVFVAVGTAGDLVFPFSGSTGITAIGALSLSLGSAATVSDNALAVSSNSSYLYIARSGPGGGLAVYTIGSGGALNIVSGSPLATGNQPTSVVVNKAGTNIYVANQPDSTVSGYSISSNGAVAVLSPATSSTVAEPRVLAVDNSGNYLLATAYVSTPDLSMYSYSSTSGLTFATSTSTTTSGGAEPAGAISVAATH
jgi:6-phosphogluconolactonase (cycloisomerase 2 family)